MTIKTTEKGGVITWDSVDFRAGLAPQGGQSSFIKYVGQPGFATGTRIDPFIRYGALSPGRGSSVAATNVGSLASAIVAMEMTDNSTGLGVDAGGRIQNLTTSASTVVVSTTSPFPHTITGTSPVGQDGILYRHNSGGSSVVSFFYSYYNNANWDVGARVNLAGTPDDDFMSTVPTNPLDVTSGDGDDSLQRTAPHPLEIGADGILYIGSGRYVHAYDGNTGTNGTFYSKVLTLPQGTQIIAMKKFKDIFLIACNYYSSPSLSGTGQALMYTWDYTSLDIIDIVDLEDFTVSALFLWKGSPTVITNGQIERNGTNKIKVITGNSVTKVADYYEGGQPTNRGVVVANDVIYINSGGYITAIGDRFAKGNATNNIALINGTNVGYSGVLLFNQLRSCLMGSTAASNGTSPSFHNMDNGFSNADVKYPFVFPPFPTGMRGSVKNVEIEYYTTNSGTGAVTVQFDIDNGSATYTIVNAESTIGLPLVKIKTRTSSGDITGASFGSFTSIRPSLSWTAGTTSPQISRISIEYSLIATTN